MKRTFAALFVAVLAMPVLAGCGSSSNSSSSSTATISKAEFVKKGNAICKKGNKQINAAANKLFGKNKKPSQAQITKFANDTIVPSVQSQVNQIKALGAPKGDEAKVNAITSDAQKAVDQVKKNPALVIQNGPGPFKQVNKEASAYGLTVCGSG